jgi:alpha-L-fucosidase
MERPASSSWAWRCTKKITPAGTTLYLHLFQWPANGQFLVPGLISPIAQACLLQPGPSGTPEKLAAANGPKGVTIFVPAHAPDKIASVIVLKLKGPVELQP